LNIDATVAGDRRRLAVCLLVAGALHAVVLLTIEIPDVRPPDRLPTIDMRLGQKPAEVPPPDDVDVETNSADEAPKPVATQAPPERIPSPLPAPEVQPEPPETEPAAEPRPSVLADATTRDLARAITAQAQELSARHRHERGADESSRIRRLVNPPSDDPELAYYLDSWRRKVERVGNINYPREARVRGLSGTLRLLVVIDPDGELQDVRVLASSGHSLLDDGAVRIVNLAAPFSPFTTSMRARIDLLEIERTWRFRKDRLTPMP